MKETNKKLIKTLGFSPKENATGVYVKKYGNHDNYTLEIDFDDGQFNFGELIKAESKTTQNFNQTENWVVLECVDRLLEKGYKPENIVLEKTYKVGHGASGGRLDILVTRDNSAYMMIECKTWGEEFDKALNKTLKDGDQLLSYFQQDTSAEVLVLYTSQLNKGDVYYKNEIIKIEEHYRQAGNVEDVYDRWNKITNSYGVFDDWVKPYLYESKSLIKKDLKPLTEEDSSKIFHEFLSILRKHSVSDKPNAFNKIFNLFLAKIFDEKKREHAVLEFQWIEGVSNPVDFQINLINLYKQGMHAFLEKEVQGISDDMFSNVSDEELLERKKHILLFDKVFDIKEVFDNETFEDNHKILKEVVQLLQGYQVRYPRKQKHLSDFFERLLTTGLKQEAGQFFTPPPITRFIIRSLPITEYIQHELNQPVPELPAIIDYSVGSGHFLTEAMEEYQRVIDNEVDTSKLSTDEAEEKVQIWQLKKYDWASKYVYGIEKDYRLVKVAKVGCYFYGDGLAQVIHGDGLDSFEHSKSYRGLLHKNAHKPQFSFIVSNPPYSVSSFKGDLKNLYAKDDFELFDSLTDRSSEIECLFVERTKQLLKTDGIASIILPSSILSNTGIYTQTREIILKSFDIVAITELGSNTFMATGTNTVVLFLKRKDDQISENITNSLDTFFANYTDITINGIEKPVSKYLAHVWDNIGLDDYVSMLTGKANKAIQAHDIYQEYTKKLKGDDKTRLEQICTLEKEKLLYFILAYPQQVVLVKTGQKKDEKQFLGYEFSNRRGNEGMHPIQRSKTIDECTSLYDVNDLTNPNKASSYIYNAFAKGDFNADIPDDLKQNISYQNLVDMLTFDRVDFEKNISLNAKKKLKIESQWEQRKLGDIAQVIRGVTYSNANQTTKVTNNIILPADNISLEGKLKIIKPVYLQEDYLISKEKKLVANDIFMCFSSGSKAHLGKVAFISKEESYYAGGFMGIVRVHTENKAKYIYQLLNTLLRQSIRDLGSGSNINNLSNIVNDVKIPLPPPDIQQKIVDEIEVLEKIEEKAQSKLLELRESVYNFLSKQSHTKKPLRHFLEIINPNKNDVINGLDLKTSVSFLSMSDVSNDGRVENIQHRTLEQVKTGYTFFQNNDVLFAKITPCMENGKGALVENLENNIGFGSTEFFVLRANKELVKPKLLFYISQSGDLRKKAEQNMTGTSGHRRVPKSFIESYEVSLPSLIEQQKIVNEIEKIEAKIAELERKIADIPQQKETVLKKYL